MALWHLQINFFKLFIQIRSAVIREATTETNYNEESLGLYQLIVLISLLDDRPQCKLSTETWKGQTKKNAAFSSRAAWFVFLSSVNFGMVQAPVPISSYKPARKTSEFPFSSSHGTSLSGINQNSSGSLGKWNELLFLRRITIIQSGHWALKNL